MPPCSSKRHSGFTLVELSIVLVIIGLILGGVMIGREMIRQTQVKSVISEVDGYFSAAQMFIGKYGCIPGDCTNATTFWGSTVANGNGDGHLDVATANNPAEIFGAWQQLAKAGLIKGVYNGITGPGASNNQAIIGTNVPGSKMTGAGYTWYYYGAVSGSADHYNGYYENFMWFGNQSTTSVTSGYALTPAEAYQIDLKMDNGIPGTGTVRTWYSATNCNTGTVASPQTSTYNMSYSGIACAVLFLSGF